MTLTIAQRPLYSLLASANSEASDWRSAKLEAHAAFSQCGFFVRSSLLFTGGLCGESQDSPFSLSDGTPIHTVCPPQLALWSAGLQNLLKETAMQPTYNLTHAVRQYLRGNLSTQDAQDLAFSICLDVKNVLTVLSDALKQTNRLSTESDIARTLETCAALIETANEIQSKEV